MICDKDLSANHSFYQRHSADYKPYTFFSWAQPWIAWMGLIGCILVFCFSSATWWNTPVNFTKVAVAYAAVRYFLNVASLTTLANSES